MLVGLRRWGSTVFWGVMLAATMVGCRKEQAPPEELFAARSLGLDFLQRGQLPEAEEQFKKIVSLAPQEPLGHANLGLTYLHAGRLAEAETELRRARKLDSASTDIALMLAKLYVLTNRRDAARALLEPLRDGPEAARVLYALAELEGEGEHHVERLREVLQAAPANLAVRLQLIDLLVRAGEADSAVRHLEAVRRQPPEPPQDVQPYLERALQLLRAGKLVEARGSLDRFLRTIELTAPYQASLEKVKWLEGPLVGRPVLTFTPQFLITLGAARRETATTRLHFTDATSDAYLPESNAVAAFAVGDYDGDGTDDLFAAPRLYHAQGGLFLDATETSGLTAGAGAVFATFADVDNDGWLDLFVIGADGRGQLFRNRGNGKFADVTARAGVADVGGGGGGGGGGGARKALFVDLDHDGDLDLVLVGGVQRLVYRNNLDGSFTEAAAALGLSGRGGRDAAFGDFDGDGRIDLVVTDSVGNTLYLNGGATRFRDATAASGLTGTGESGAIAVGDYNNDGLLDLFVASMDGSEPALWSNQGDGTFTRDRRSTAVLQRLRAAAGLDARFVDYDNDGWLDLIVAGTPLGGGVERRAVFLLHNDGRGRFADRSSLLPPTIQAGASVAAVDVDGDGDQDLFLGDPSGGLRLLRNEGGNASLSVQVQLVALRTGSGKNNDFGIGARIELRAGEIYQTRVVTSRVTPFGLGPHLKADVLRVEWPNGVPQTVYFPGTDQDVLELEMLKGSCAFLYTWDGKGFRFVTDVMWRSALGMPLGIMGGGSTAAYAPPGASQEYLRIPGSALQPRGGRYVLQVTEELWETAYTDQVRLLAVDHPDSVDVFVDERFVPPAPVDLRLFQVVRQHPPLSATDKVGNDVLPALRDRDDVYVSNLTPVRYQGLVEPHDLVLDLGEEAGRPGTFLFLRGWIYPTDASINVALSQQSSLTPKLPSLEVRDAQGRWTTALASIGFPSGKDKTIVVDLAGRFPTRDHHVRIRTNLQIYWDHAFVAADQPGAPVRLTPLDPASADLHFRGFSRMYRRGGRYGPHWFAYDDVSRTSPWRPIEGALTRYGDVLPLVKASDDMYVIMGPGDEATLQFDAGSADSLPPGWTRDFLLYTDGWIKDADLNTAFGNTVGPLPFHAIRQYPYGPGEAFPTDAAHQEYLRRYNTRLSHRR